MNNGVNWKKWKNWIKRKEDGSGVRKKKVSARGKKKKWRK
jgi:hypothetical protein